MGIQNRHAEPLRNCPIPIRYGFMVTIPTKMQKSAVMTANREDKNANFLPLRSASREKAVIPIIDPIPCTAWIFILVSRCSHISPAE